MCLSKWMSITSDQCILNAVVGYELEFSELPKFDGRVPSITFSPDERRAIDCEIQDLLSKGAISCCQRSPGDFVSHIFARTKSSNPQKIRVIINLKKLNRFIKYEHFKMEHLDSVTDLVMKNDWFISIDLADAYFSVPIAQECRKYLKFKWSGILYQYNVLCFGLACGPRVFTKCMKPVVSHLREMGIKISIYIDDMVLVNSNPSTLVNQGIYVMDLLKSLGFQINEAKSVLTPTQKIQHLGFCINSASLDVSIPTRKCEQVECLTTKLLCNYNPTIREVAVLLGTFISLCPGTKWGKLYFRNLERDKVLALAKHKGRYDSPITLSDLGKADMRWWLSSEKLIARPMVFNLAVIDIFSDASLMGWGAHNCTAKTGGRWCCSESQNHINWLELKACFLALKSFAANVSSCSVNLHLDNTSAISYIANQGGVISSLNRLAHEIWSWAKHRNLWLRAIYVKGSDNVTADQCSRVFNRNIEWSLCDSAFSQICGIFGQPDIDLFASRLNHKTVRYCSYQPDPDCLYIDAFTVNWGQFDKCYAFPPFKFGRQSDSESSL